MGVDPQNTGMSVYPSFPDEKTMERSADGTEPIRGGSVGFNRIFGVFVDRARKDSAPFCSLILINAMTVFRNNYKEDMSDQQLVAAWEKDIELFALYLGAYRVQVAGGNDPKAQTQVLVYLPTYKKIPKPLRLEHENTKLETMLERYQTFYDRYRRETGVLIDEPGVKVTCEAVGERDLPHREVYRIISTSDTYIDAWRAKKIFLISHVMLDYFLCARIQSLLVWESYTARFKDLADFGKKLDPSGDIPFNSLMLSLFGDKLFIRSVLDVKAKRFVRKMAKEFQFKTRSPAFMAQKLSQLSNVPVAELAPYNFV